eukprot:363079-Chlamydomonas_euryale.AAC.4
MRRRLHDPRLPSPPAGACHPVHWRRGVRGEAAAAAAAALRSGVPPKAKAGPAGWALQRARQTHSELARRDAESLCARHRPRKTRSAGRILTVQSACTDAYKGLEIVRAPVSSTGRCGAPQRPKWPGNIRVRRVACSTASTGLDALSGVAGQPDIYSSSWTLHTALASSCGQTVAFPPLNGPPSEQLLPGRGWRSQESQVWKTKHNPLQQPPVRKAMLGHQPPPSLCAQDHAQPPASAQQGQSTRVRNRAWTEHKSEACKEGRPWVQSTSVGVGSVSKDRRGCKQTVCGITTLDGSASAS